VAVSAPTNRSCGVGNCCAVAHPTILGKWMPASHILRIGDATKGFALRCVAVGTAVRRAAHPRKLPGSLAKADIRREHWCGPNGLARSRSLGPKLQSAGTAVRGEFSWRARFHRDDPSSARIDAPPRGL